MLMPGTKTLIKIYVIQLIFFGLIIIGILPREAILFLALLQVGYTLWASLENTIVFFAMSIPFFVALPITTGFDQLNIWRILSGLIFLRWLSGEETIAKIRIGIKRFFIAPVNFIQGHKVLSILSALFLLSMISITQAQSAIISIKRIIYFINLSLIGIVVYDLMRKNRDFIPRIIKAIAFPTVIVALVGFAQLGMTYLMDVYQFMHVWGEGIQCRLFGEQWCYIATYVGNTWLAYYGDQLSLRMFSIFPDSHSFPTFLLLGLSSVFALGFIKKSRVNFWTIAIPLIFLAMILSGTRGIWAASIIALMFSGWAIFRLKKRGQKESSGILKRVMFFTSIFFVLFAVAFPIFSSPQFLVGKMNSKMLRERVRSIIDFGETSNSQRLEIWRKSLKSIVKHPVAGVGIGNFPVVLGQKLQLARAGSSAHNLYLHIAAELGLPALALSLWFLWILIKKILANFIASNDKLLKVYFAALLIFLPWVLIYNLTDPIIFDERVFLLFTIVTAAIFSHSCQNNSKCDKKKKANWPKC